MIDQWPGLALIALACTVKPLESLQPGRVKAALETVIGLAVIAVTITGTVQLFTEISHV